MRKDYGEELAWLYEDAYTTRRVKDFKMTKTGILTWYEQDFWNADVRKNREVMLDEDDAKEWLKFWRACFRRAKRYNEMPLEVLEAIQEGEIEDIEEN
jgi:hypothetical protein